MNEILSAKSNERSWPALSVVAICCVPPFAIVAVVAGFDLEDVGFGLFNLGGIVLLAIFGGLMAVLRKVFPGVSCCSFYEPVATTRVCENRSSSYVDSGHDLRRDLPVQTMKTRPSKSEEAAGQGTPRWVDSFTEPEREHVVQ